MFVLATSSVILLTLTHLVNSDLNYKTLHFQIILGNFEHLPSSYGSKCNFIFQFCQYNYYSPKNSFAPFCTRQEKTIKKKQYALVGRQEAIKHFAPLQCHFDLLWCTVCLRV